MKMTRMIKNSGVKKKMGKIVMEISVRAITVIAPAWDMCAPVRRIRFMSLVK